jgi:DNA-binding CsgD family transcriptional regulator/tetratricopeptide (TPR) repeat protein
MTDRRSASPVINRAATLVSRDREQAQLADSLARVDSGQTELVLISGEPGIGKSRLLREFLTAQSVDVTVLSATCYEDTATPFAPILSAFRLLADDPPTGWEEILHESGLSHVLGRNWNQRLSSIDHQTSRQLADQFAVAIQKLASHQTVILSIDDAQWASEPDLDLVRYILRSSSRKPILIVLSYRDTELVTRHPLQHLIRDAARDAFTSRISLTRLDEHGARQLIGNVLGTAGHTVHRTLAQAIQREAEGVPFFIEEVVFHLYETGALERDGKNWILREDAGIAIPQSIRGVIGHRLQMLSLEAQETLSIAAVIGNEFGLNHVVAVSRRIDGASAEDIGAHLLDALERSLVIERRSQRRWLSEERFAFAHDQIRDVLYGELNAIRRRILHQAAGESLEEIGNPDDPGYHAALAFHFGAGEDIQKASSYAESAGDAAMRLNAFRQAADYYTAALEIHTLRRDTRMAAVHTVEREMRLLNKRQAAFRHTGDTGPQWRDLERWHHLATESDDDSQLFSATSEMVRHATQQGDANAADRMAGELLELAHGDEKRERIAWIRRGEAAAGRVLGDPARLYRPVDRLEAAHEAYENARSLTPSAHEELPSILIELGILEWELSGEDDRKSRADARSLIAEALELFRAQNDDRGEVTALIALAYRRVINSTETTEGTPFIGFLEEIRRLRSEERRLIRESDRARNEARAALAVHIHCREFGIPGRALESGIDALNWAEASGDRRIAFYALGGLSQTELLLGNVVSALDFAERAMAITESGFVSISRERANQWLGVASIAAGQQERGVHLLRDAIQDGDNAALSPADLDTMTLLARALAEESTPESNGEAFQLLDRIQNTTSGMRGSIPWGVEALLIRSSLNRQAGQLEEALVDAQTALARYREREIELWRLHVEVPFRLARLLIDLGRSQEAIEHLRSAADQLFRAAEHISDPDRHAAFLEEVPLHRDLYYLSAEAGVWPGAAPKKTRQTRPGGLSNREVEVLKLVAIGKTNRDIADELFISEKTVARHLTNIYTKIGSESRTQAAAWAYQNAVA